MLKQFCQECGTEATEEQRFCRECGAELEQAAPQIPVSPAADSTPRVDFTLSRNKGLGWAALISLILVIGILKAISVPGFSRARVQAKKKACVSNMKTLEGAAELYLMEHEKVMALTIREFVAQGYLKTEPKCPSDGLYTIRVGPPGPGSKFPRVSIHCSIHKGIDDTTTGL